MALPSMWTACGVITTLAWLDYEIKIDFSFDVRATDGGSPSRSATRLVIVHVSDANDNAPVFSPSEYSGSVGEDGLAGEVVADVNATDVDTGPRGSSGCRKRGDLACSSSNYPPR